MATDLRRIFHLSDIHFGLEDNRALARCLEELQGDHRRSIKLAFFEGYSHSELAEKVNVPLGTMKSWIRRGLAGLKGCLGG